MQQFGLATAIAIVTLGIISIPAQACDQRAIVCQPDPIAQEFIETAIALSQKIKNPIHQAASLANIASTYRFLNLPNRDVLTKALAIITPVPHSEEKDSVLHRIASEYAQDGQYYQAIKAIEQLKDSTQRAQASDNALRDTICAFLKTGKDKEAAQLLDNSRQIAINFPILDGAQFREVLEQDHQFVTPLRRIALLNDVARLCIASNQAQVVLKALEQAYSRSIVLLSSQSLNSRAPQHAYRSLFLSHTLIELAQRLSQAEQKNKAVELLNQVEKILIEKPVSLNLQNFQRLAEGWIQLEQSDRALKLVPIIVKGTPDNELAQVNFLTQLAIAIFDPSDIPKADNLLTHARTLTQTISHQKQRVTALVMVASAYQRVHQNLAAYAIAKEITQLPVAVWQDQSGIAVLFEPVAEYEQAEKAAIVTKDDDSLARLIDIYLEKGQIDRTLQIAATTSSTQSQSKALAASTKYFIRTGQVDRAIQTIQKSSSTASRSESLAMIAAYLTSTKQFDRALEITQTITSSRSKAEALANIAVKYAASGQLEKGSDTMVQAFRAAEPIESEDQEIWAIADVFSAYIQERNQPQTLENIIKLTQSVPDAAHRDAALLQLLIGHRIVEKAQSIRVTDWLRFSDAIVNLKVRDHALSMIAYLYAERDEFLNSLQVIEQIKSPEQQTETLGRVIERHPAPTLSLAEQKAFRELLLKLIRQ